MLLATKFWLVPRLNINWDEFYFLTLIHAQARHELTQGLQTAYTHLFTWLPRFGGDELEQIRLARVLMVGLLGTSALLLQRLAARWFAPLAAWTAALAFLSMWPVLKHGGSFRADSLLLPLHLAALLLLTHPRLAARGRGISAGLLLGLATAVSVKTVLLAPIVAVFGISGAKDWRHGLRCLAWLGVSAAALAAVLLGSHLLATSPAAAETATISARGAWQKTMVESQWIPQRWVLQDQLRVGMITWLAAGAGLAWALWRRLWPVASGVLALLPILFYRNTFPYYYVVMWAPACLAIAATAQGVQEFLFRHGSNTRLTTGAGLALAALLASPGLRQMPYLSFPRQSQQRELVAAVHTIFREPVAYIDHSGMIAAFTKANFFMSSWGVEHYLALGQPFMPAALERYRPPLLIRNRQELMPGSAAFARLLAADQRMLLSFYQPYWGPIFIAGAAATFESAGRSILQLPFGGNYRIESPYPVRIDGNLLEPGSIIAVPDSQLLLDIAVLAHESPQTVRLLWADARPPPAIPPSSLDYYDNL